MWAVFVCFCWRSILSRMASVWEWLGSKAGQYRANIYSLKNEGKGEERSGEKRNLETYTHTHMYISNYIKIKTDPSRPLPAKHPQRHLCRINPWLPRSVHNWTIGTGTAKKRWLRFQIATVWSGWIFWRHVVTGSQLCTLEMAINKFACECSIQTSSKWDEVSYGCLFNLSGFPYKMHNQWTREIFAMIQSHCHGARMFLTAYLNAVTLLKYFYLVEITTDVTLLKYFVRSILVKILSATVWNSAQGDPFHFLWLLTICCF